MAGSNLTSERIRELLAYDAETGIISWRNTRGAGMGMQPAGSAHNGRYIRICVDGEKHFAHRLIWIYVFGEWPRNAIDHIDGDGRNNRLSNLRDVSHSINMQNKRLDSNNRSGLLGVTWHVSGWQSRIMVGGKSVHLGQFASKHDAHVAYIHAKRKLHPGSTL